MSETTAIRIALDLLHMPSRVRYIRTQPLPSGIERVLLIAAGDREAHQAAELETGRSAAILLDASSFFIEQVLLHSESDAYRVLGVRSDASATELRHHLALLLRWLHPDLGPKDDRAVFITRVTAAWELLKSTERRAAYDASLRHAGAKRTGAKTRLARGPYAGTSLPTKSFSRDLVSHEGGPPRIGFLRMLSLYISSFRR